MEKIQDLSSSLRTPIKEGELSRGRDQQLINQQQWITSCSLVILVEFFKFLLFLQYFVILVFLVKYNNFSINFYNNSFISVFLVKYSKFTSNFFISIFLVKYINSFNFHFIYFNLFIVTFLLRLWGTIKGTREPIFRLIRSLIFGSILV